MTNAKSLRKNEGYCDIWQFLFGWIDDFLDNLPKRFGCAIFSLIIVEVMAVLWFLVALFSASGRDKVWEWTNSVIEWPKHCPNGIVCYMVVVIKE